MAADQCHRGRKVGAAGILDLWDKITVNILYAGDLDPILPERPRPAERWLLGLAKGLLRQRLGWAVCAFLWSSPAQGRPEAVPCPVQIGSWPQLPPSLPPTAPCTPAGCKGSAYAIAYSWCAQLADMQLHGHLLAGGGGWHTCRLCVTRLLRSVRAYKYSRKTAGQSSAAQQMHLCVSNQRQEAS